jgi:hypothetical protein
VKILTKTKKRIAGVVLLTGFAVGVSCAPTAPTEAPPRERGRGKTETLTVFITGNTLGELKPCGCSGGQLGGFDRRAVVFNSVPADKRLIMDTGSLVRGDVRQDLIKFNISVQALSILDYDLVNLSAKDIEISQSLGLLDDPILGLISPYPAGEKISRKFENRYVLDGKPVTLCVLTYDVEASPIELIKEAFGPRTPGERKVNILLINQCNEAVMASIAKLEIVDCLICPSLSDEPMIMGEPDGKPLAFSVGRYGRYICKLQIERARNKDELTFDFQSIPVKEELAQATSLINLYKDYQHLVKEASLLEEHPRFILPDGLKYAGSRSCMACHAYEYDKWSGKVHARAFATLERVGSNFDPECVVCHVVGMDYQSGFITQDKTPHMKDVGCENCHGPGSEHIKAQGMTKLTEPKSTCADCHTPDHSGEYAGNEDAFRQKIVHWREPNAANPVK